MRSLGRDAVRRAGVGRFRLQVTAEESLRVAAQDCRGRLGSNEDRIEHGRRQSRIEPEDEGQAQERPIGLQGELLASARQLRDGILLERRGGMTGAGCGCGCGTCGLRLHHPDTGSVRPEPRRVGVEVIGRTGGRVARLRRAEPAHHALPEQGVRLGRLGRRRRPEGSPGHAGKQAVEGRRVRQPEPVHQGASLARATVGGGRLGRDAQGDRLGTAGV